MLCENNPSIVSGLVSLSVLSNDHSVAVQWKKNIYRSNFEPSGAGLNGGGGGGCSWPLSSTFPQ